MEAKKAEVTSGEMVTDKVELVWRIENFALMWKSEEFRRSQKLRFQAGSSIGLASDWKAYFVEKEGTSKTPGGSVKKDRYLWVGLEKVPAGVKELMASAKLRMKAERHVDNREISVAAANLISNNGSGPSSALSWRMISDAWNLPLINGCLVMELEVTVMKPKDGIPLPPQQSQQIEAMFKPRFSEKIQQDLGKLLEGPNMQSDATIVSKDKVKFPVNRCILSERSPVFEKMFQTRMTESQSGIVLIPDLSSKTVRVLLQFLYSGTLHQDWSEEQVLVELVYAANKYELQDLVDFLDQAVGRVCTKGNAGKLFSLLGKLGMQTGEREVHNFITKHTLNFEDMASFVEEGTQEQDDKSGKWNVFRMLQNSWRMVLGSSSKKSSSQKT